MGVTKKDKKDNLLGERSIVQESSINLGVEEGKVKKNSVFSNRNYLVISIHALMVIIVGAFVIYLFFSMKQVKEIISEFLNTISPFLVAFFIAFMMNPLIEWIHQFMRRKLKIKSRMLRVFLSIFVSYLIVLGGVIVTLLYVVPQLIQSISDLVANQNKMYEEFYRIYDILYSKYPNLNMETIATYIDNMIPDLISQGTQFLSSMIPKLYMFSVSLIKMLINILLSIVISCYIILDKKNLKLNAKRFIFSIIPEQAAKGFIETNKECASIFNKFMVGKFIDSLIIGILCFILMTLLKLPYSILLSVIVGITNMIPYFGPFIGAIPGIVIYVLINPMQCLIFAVMIFVLQQFDGLYLGPKILGDSIGIKPLWIIFAITVGGAYAGVLGMFLGVPVIAVISFLLEKFIKKRLAKKNIVIEKVQD